MDIQSFLKRGLIATSILHVDENIDPEHLKQLVDVIDQMPPQLILENSVNVERIFRDLKD